MDETMLEHVVIRRPEFVAGTRERPNVQVFVQSRTDRMPLAIERLQPGQIVWMKWVRGPIVARGRLESWQVGRVVSGDIDAVREFTAGTPLHALERYWTDLQKRGDAYVVVVWITEGEWLDRLIYPRARSHGRSWIYLDTDKKREDWLSHYKPPVSTKEAMQGLPWGIRFDVLRRDSFTCQYCGRAAPEVELHVDHRVPRSKGGSHDPENLATACQECNIGKRDKII